MIPFGSPPVSTLLMNFSSLVLIYTLNGASDLRRCLPNEANRSITVEALKL